MNRALMVFAGMALLLLLEFLTGDLGFYFPYTALGLFYFVATSRRRKWYWFLPLAIVLGIMTDAVYSRVEYGSGLVNVIAVLLGWRYRNARGASGALSVLMAMGISGGAVFLRYSVAFWGRSAWLENWQGILAYSLFAALFGAVVIILVIIGLEFLAKILGIRRQFGNKNRTEMEHFNATRPDDED